MGNLGGELEKKLSKLGIKKQVEASMIVEEAQKKLEEIFGERGVENLQAVSYRNGTLKICASNNLWAAECQGKVSQLTSSHIKKVIFSTTRIEKEN